MSFDTLFFRALGVVLVGSVAFDARAEDAPTIDRATLVAEALRGHPAVRAAEQRADAMRRVGDAEGSLPPPEAMAQVWQVPLAKPYAIGDAQMVMLGVGQTFPAVGARGARRLAAERDADAEQAMVGDTARQIRREVGHAFADYVETDARHRIHGEHLAIATRTVALARARYAAGASLADLTQAEVELARTEADVVTDGTRIEGARAKINAYLGKDPLASLAPPAMSEPETSAWDVGTALANAREKRPELRATAARRDARREEARAADREASIPSFSVAALYFVPTSPMPEHGYGVNASMSLPWLWQGADARRDAQRKTADAAASDAEAARRPVEAEVGVQEANVRGAALRLQILRDRALPAGKRSFDVAWAGYEAARTDVLTLLSARRAVVDVETELVTARATLDHALVELDAAVGIEVPRRPVGPLASTASVGAADVR